MSYIPTPSILRKKGQTADEKRLAEEHGRGIDDNNSRLLVLERDFARQSVMLESLWSLLKQETSLDDNALLSKLEEVELLIETRVNEKAKCSACNRDVPANKKNCHYCGEKLIVEGNDSPFA